MGGSVGGTVGSVVGAVVGSTVGIIVGFVDGVVGSSCDIFMQPHNDASINNAKKSAIDFMLCVPHFCPAFLQLDVYPQTPHAYPVGVVIHT